MKNILYFLNALIWALALVEAAIIVKLRDEYDDFRAMNKGPVTIYEYPKTIPVTEDIDLISRLDILEIEHFKRDSMHVVIIKYTK